MASIGSATAGTAWFLNGLANLQNQQERTERELSSGFQIQDASDAPAETPELVSLGAGLASLEAYQTNLGGVQAEANAADSSLSQAISLIQNAQTLAEQGANTTSSAAQRQNLAAQVVSTQQQLVSLANTSVAGRFIFAGDNDGSAPYQYDAASATGVDSLATQTATRTVVNPQGAAVYQSLTAQQIFDPVDTLGAPTSGNTFAALQSLATALNSNDQAGIADALASLGTASTYVNQQQAYYGAAEQRITNEQNTAANQITAIQARIGDLRDTNVAEAATDLAQENTDQQAALGAESEISRKTLFDFLG